MRHYKGFLILILGFLSTLALGNAGEASIGESRQVFDTKRPVIDQPNLDGVTTTINLGAARDNTLYEDGTGSLSNGQGQHLFAGKTDEGIIRRGLLAFDLANNIPPDSIIISATLQLRVTKVPLGPLVSEQFSIHRLMADWGEGDSIAPGFEGSGGAAQSGDATWLHTFYDISQWSDVGGDFQAPASATIEIAGTGVYTWQPTTAMLLDLNRWLGEPESNHGWIVIGDESRARTARRFGSSENSIPADRPTLFVEYAPAKTQYLPFVMKP